MKKKKKKRKQDEEGNVNTCGGFLIALKFPRNFKNQKKRDDIRKTTMIKHFNQKNHAISKTFILFIIKLMMSNYEYKSSSQ